MMRSVMLAEGTSGTAVWDVWHSKERYKSGFHKPLPETNLTLTNPKIKSLFLQQPFEVM